MGDKSQSTQPEKQNAVNPPTPSQAEGDEQTVDRALNNKDHKSHEQDSSAHKSGAKQ